MSEKNILSQVPDWVIIVWALSPRLLPYWKAWLKSRDANQPASPAQPATATSDPSPTQSGESWGLIAADAVVFVLAIWRLAALSLSDAPATVGSVMQGTALGAVLVVCSLRRA